MDVSDVARLLLRVSHAIAATVWLGGGAYYVLALRPRLRGADPEALPLIREAQREFGEWASAATLVMVATGVVLTFDRLTDGRGSALYVGLLAVKVAAAAAAFWLTGSVARAARRRARRSAGSALDRTWLVLALGAVAFVLGVALSSAYPTGVGPR